MDSRQGRGHATARARTRSATRTTGSSGSTPRDTGVTVEARRVPGVRRRAAQPVHPAPAGEVRRLRRLQLRRDLDGGVRDAEVALRHDAVRREPQGRVHRRRRSTRSPTAARSGASPTSTDAAFLYYRTDKVDEAPATWQEVYAQAEGQGRHRLPGRPVRGPDLRLPRAGLRGRRRGALRGRQEGPDRLAGERQGAAVHGRRRSRTAPRPKAVTDLHGAAVASDAFETGKPTLPAQLAVRLRARPEDAEDEGQVRGRAVPGVRGRRQGRHPRRPQLRHLGLLEEPGRGAEVRRLPDQPRRRSSTTRSSSPAAGRSSATYDDPEVKKALPFAHELKQAVAQAKSRPVSQVYPQISQAIYKNVNAALVGPRVARGRDEAGAGRRSRRPSRPSRPWLRPQPSTATAPQGGAPGASRSAAWRSSWCRRRCC